MRQKTLEIRLNENIFGIGYGIPQIGDEVILYSKEHLTRGWTKWGIFYGDGYPGNMDHTVRRYHGWRGTTNDVYTEAHGLRRIISISRNKTDDGWKITVGRDPHPEWD